MPAQTVEGPTDTAARAEDKRKVGLDPQRDYTSEAACLTCHTVGFGQPGGYRIPPPNDKKANRFAATREGVGCEACHGPGGGFTQVMGDIYLKERPFSKPSSATPYQNQKSVSLPVKHYTDLFHSNCDNG